MKFAAALLLFLVAPLAAAQEPDAAFSGFHRAIRSGNFDDFLRYVPRGQRADLDRLPPSQREAQLKMMGALMPEKIQLRQKKVDPDGRGARLVMVGAGPVLVAGKPETLYGSIRMAKEGDDWKVADVSWSNTAPEGLPAEAPPETAAQKNAPTPVPPKGSAPVVGSMDAAPMRKLGTAKPPCEYKPVMTAEDLERCK